jgi:1,4-dihydroxy-2-naphthoyl-CoA hydrolase
MAIWKMPINLVLLNERNDNTLAGFLGIEFTEVGDNYLIAQMPITSRVHQPIGIMHGGASCVLAETVGSNAANFCVNQKEYYCVGLDINTNHIRSIRDGIVTAKAEAFHLGKTTQVFGIHIYDEREKLISVNRLTMAVLKRGVVE